MASLNGTPTDDTLRGTGGDDEIRGGAGDDIIIGGAGDDVIRGGAGDDEVWAGAGDDDVRGGAGDDVIRGGSGDDVLRGGAGDDVIRGGSGDDVIGGGSGDDELNGGSGDDEINGGSGDDVLASGSGDDVLAGGAGDDVLRGGAGDDVLRGGAGDDVLRGGAGDDVIEGGAGDDVLDGGAGDDRFVFTSQSSSAAFAAAATTGNGHDTIVGFDPDGDRLDLSGFGNFTLTQVGNDTLVTGEDGTQITVAGVTPEELESAIIPCVVRGTMVRTPDGDVPVETLAIGDKVVSIDGTVRQIRWIGQRSYARAFIERNPKVAPIRIRAGALGDGTPTADLIVSPEHALYLDNALIPARFLTNGDTISPISTLETVDYFHVELDGPDVVWTNGAPTETYVNHGNRRMFSNWNEYVARYGREDEAARGTNGDYVRRFKTVYSGPALQAIRARLNKESLDSAA